MSSSGTDVVVVPDGEHPLPSGVSGHAGGLLTLSWLRHPKAQLCHDRGITK